MANIRDPYDGTYFTGVGAMLEITPRDAAGNPITGIAVKEEVTTESGELVRQRKEAIPVGPDGTFTDLVGIGKIPRRPVLCLGRKYLICGVVLLKHLARIIHEKSPTVIRSLL
jgi:hypothetical protein